MIRKMLFSVVQFAYKIAFLFTEFVFYV